MYEKAISYSGLSLYRKCPKAWADAYIAGNRGPSGAAAQRGTALHKNLDTFFKADYPLGQNSILKKWGPYMEQLKAIKPTSELELGATADWGPAEFNDPKANARGAIDLMYTIGTTLHIKDWKSGRVYPSHEDQGRFYAALAQAYSPQERYVVEMVYLDIHGHILSWNYTHDQVIHIQDALGEEITELRLDKEYAPTPTNEACKWCSLSWRNGGECHAAP